MNEIECVVHFCEGKEICHVIDGAEGFWMEMDRLPAGVAEAFRIAERDCTSSKTVSQFVSHTG